jgi:hypothetical protein
VAPSARFEWVRLFAKGFARYSRRLFACEKYWLPNKVPSQTALYAIGRDRRKMPHEGLAAFAGFVRCHAEFKFRFDQKLTNFRKSEGRAFGFNGIDKSIDCTASVAFFFDKTTSTRTIAK